MSILTEELISLDLEVDNAEDAIRGAGNLLLSQGKIEERYIEAMIKGFKDIGPYIVLAPGIAIPHGRPEHGVFEQSASVVRLKNPVVFGHPTNDPVSLVCAICGTDNISHITMLQSLSAVLGDKEKYKKILTASTKKELIDIFQL